MNYISPLENIKNKCYNDFVKTFERISMNKYLRAYYLYTDQLREFALNEPLFFVKTGVLPLNNLEKYGISSKDEKELKIYFKHKFNFGDGSDDGEGGREMTLVEVLDMGFPVKTTLLKILKKLITLEDSDIKEKLQKLLTATEDTLALLNKVQGRVLASTSPEDDFDEQGDIFEQSPMQSGFSEYFDNDPSDETFLGSQNMALPMSPANVLTASSTSSAEQKEILAIDPIIAQSFSFPLLATSLKSIPTPVKKAYELRQYFYDHSAEESYLPTEQIAINTSKFMNLTREDIVSLFSPENFYKLSKDDIKALLQAASNEYLLSNDVEPCAVVFEPLKISNRNVQFGEHNPNRGVTIINSKLLDKFDEMKDINNVSYPYQLLATVIHEGRHRCQFSDLNNNIGANETTKLISRALLVPQSTMSKGEYLASPDEIDARNAAMDYISGVAKETDDENLKAFYNQQKAYEQSNGKNEVPDSLKQHFNHVYSTTRFKAAKKLDRDRAKMFESLTQSSASTQPAS